VSQRDLDDDGRPDEVVLEGRMKDKREDRPGMEWSSMKWFL
jgi:hypothetical protein